MTYRQMPALSFLCHQLQPQLASGRVSIAPKVFRDALPEDYRKFFVIDDAETGVSLPCRKF